MPTILNTSHRLRGVITTSSILWLSLACGSLACGSEALNNELAAMAKTMAKILSARNHDVVAMGQFTGPPTFPTSAGPGIQKVLSEELAKQDITVKSRAPVGIEGRYRVVSNEVDVPGNTAIQQELVAMRITAAIIDQEGRALTELVSPIVEGVELEQDGTLQIEVQDEETVLELTGVPTDLDPIELADAGDRSEKIRENLQDPPLDLINGTRVSAGSTSPYAIEVLVDGLPRTPVYVDGLPFIELAHGQSYTIRLHNDSPYDAAVKLAIDGLSTFTFSDVRHQSDEKRGQVKYDSWIVPRERSVIIQGWHRTNTRADSFRITEYAESAASSLSQSSQVGTISAIFSAAWRKDESPPEDEPGSAKSGKQGNATGIGPPIQRVVDEVEREIGAIRASVSLRYTK